MRKIRRPNLSVKPREVFYRLKRSRNLGGLSESCIEEILESARPDRMVDMGCLYETLLRPELELHASDLQIPVCFAATLACATLGGAELEAAAKRAAECGEEPRQRVLLAWACAMLDKLVEFANTLIREEAAAENLETGPAVDMDVLPWVWKRMQLSEKLQVRYVDEAGSIRLVPAFTRLWVIPWLTKKEKKQLVQAPTAP